MGTTLVTLNIYNAERAAIMPLLSSTDQLRDQNAPWLTVVPSHDVDEDAFMRLGKIARRITKDGKTVALLFLYFDDEIFRCSFYQNGKKSASCENDKSWAKLGKKIGECFGDDIPSKAFRYASHCNDIEEQLNLLEETIGTALYELPEAEPRIVKRCDTTLQEIKTREARLRKRPNRFMLTELDFADWPEEQKYRQKVLTMLRPQWRKYQLDRILFCLDMKQYMIPNADAMISYPYMVDWDEGLDNLFLMNGKTGEHKDISSYSGQVCNTVWQTKTGGIVILLCHPFYQSQKEPNKPRYSVVCLDKDGTEQWCFKPDINTHQNMCYMYSSEQGVITFFASGIDAIAKEDARIWQIDGETGELLRTYRCPYEEDVYYMMYINSMNNILFYRRSTNELVLLNDSLEVVRCIDGFEGSSYFFGDRQCGSIIFTGDCWNHRYASLLDLQNGTHKRIDLEIPAYVKSVLPDGRILGLNGKQNTLIVFNKEGIVEARCHVPGVLFRAVTENGKTYLIELRGPDTHGLIYGGLFDETTTHIWRLDPL